MSFADAVALLNKGSAGNSVSAPASQRYILMPTSAAKPGQPAQQALTTDSEGKPLPAAPPGFQWVENVNYGKAPSTAAPKGLQTVGNSDVGYYLYDPSAAPDQQLKLAVPAKTPNADEEMTKAIDRYTREGELAEKQRNYGLTGSWATDQEMFDRNMKLQQAGVDAGRLKLDWAKQDEDQRQFDIKQAAEDKKTNDVLLTGAANRGQIGANTAQIQQTTARTAAMLPGELSQQQATLAGTLANTSLTDAQKQEVLQKIQLAGVPTVQNAPSATQLYTYQYDPKTGQMSQSGMNPEYQAKTLADVQARVGQIQGLMAAKGADVQKRVDAKQITPEQGMAEYQQWVAQNVTPQRGALEAAQNEVLYQRAKDQAEAQRNAYSTALTAGSNAVSAFNAANANRVGPNFEAANAAASRGDFAALANIQGATSYQAPDITQTSQQAVMDALKYISPTAAMATGTPMPNYAGMDIGAALGPSQYMPGGGTAAAAPVPVGAGVGAGAQDAAAAAASSAGAGAGGMLSGGPSPDDWLAQWQARQAADARLQQYQRSITTPMTGWMQSAPGFGTYSYGG